MNAQKLTQSERERCLAILAQPDLPTVPAKRPRAPHSPSRRESPTPKHRTTQADRGQQSVSINSVDASGTPSAPAAPTRPAPTRPRRFIIFNNAPSTKQLEAPLPATPSTFTWHKIPIPNTPSPDRLSPAPPDLPAFNDAAEDEAWRASRVGLPLAPGETRAGVCWDPPRVRNTVPLKHTNTPPKPDPAGFTIVFDRVVSTKQTVDNALRATREKEGWELACRCVAHNSALPAPRLSHTKVYLMCNNATVHVTDLAEIKENHEVSYAVALQETPRLPISSIILRSVSALGSSPHSVCQWLAQWDDQVPLAVGLDDGCLWMTVGALRGRLQRLVDVVPLNFGLSSDTSPEVILAGLSVAAEVLKSGVALDKVVDKVGTGSESKEQAVEMCAIGVARKFLSGVMDVGAKRALEGERSRPVFDLPGFAVPEFDAAQLASAVDVFNDDTPYQPYQQQQLPPPPSQFLSSRPFFLDCSDCGQQLNAEVKGTKCNSCSFPERAHLIFPPRPVQPTAAPEPDHCGARRSNWASDATCSNKKKITSAIATCKHGVDKDDKRPRHRACHACGQWQYEQQKNKTGKTLICVACEAIESGEQEGEEWAGEEPGMAIGPQYEVQCQGRRIGGRRETGHAHYETSAVMDYLIGGVEGCTHRCCGQCEAYRKRYKSDGYRVVCKLCEGGAAGGATE